MIFSSGPDGSPTGGFSAFQAGFRYRCATGTSSSRKARWPHRSTPLFQQENAFGIILTRIFSEDSCMISMRSKDAISYSAKKIMHCMIFSSGPDGSRTRVRRKIPCPSTSVVYYFTFPPHSENKHPKCFSSFMIRPMPQSFGNVVSHIVEARVLKCECSKSDCCN